MIDDVVERVQRWFCEIEDEGNYDLVMASTEHSGDCTKNAWTCGLCQKERIIEHAAQFLALLQPGDEVGDGLRVVNGYDSFPLCRAEQAAAIRDLGGALTDDVAERVARAIADAADKDMDDGLWAIECRRDAKAAIAALQPGDYLGGIETPRLGLTATAMGADLTDRLTKTINERAGIERAKAAEAMRERCAVEAAKYHQHPGMLAAIRKLEVE